MWDGRHDALYNQPFGPIESPVEMNSSRLYAAEQIFIHQRDEYEKIFGALAPLDDVTRFPQLAADQTGCEKLDANLKCIGTMHGVPGDGSEYDGLSRADQDAVTRVVVNVGKALGAYERLLTCGSTRFDAWMKGDDTALNRAEQRGAALFVEKATARAATPVPILRRKIPQRWAEARRRGYGLHRPRRSRRSDWHPADGGRSVERKQRLQRRR